MQTACFNDKAKGIVSLDDGTNVVLCDWCHAFNITFPDGQTSNGKWNKSQFQALYRNDIIEPLTVKCDAGVYRKFSKRQVDTIFYAISDIITQIISGEDFRRNDVATDYFKLWDRNSGRYYLARFKGGVGQLEVKSDIDNQTFVTRILDSDIRATIWFQSFPHVRTEGARSMQIIVDDNLRNAFFDYLDKCIAGAHPPVQGIKKMTLS